MPEGECWNWKGAKDPKGYGIAQGNRKIGKVHRLVYELAYEKELTPADTILHLCDNPSCANPAHLLRGNSTDNNLDMMLKCRGRFKELSDNYARFIYEKLKKRFEPASQENV